MAHQPCHVCLPLAFFSAGVAPPCFSERDLSKLMPNISLYSLRNVKTIFFPFLAQRRDCDGQWGGGGPVASWAFDRHINF
jgi:hypothetical protein